MMSKANVEIVRHYYEVLDSALERYWASPDGPISASPVIEDVLALMSEDPEWDSWLRAKPFRGREEILAGADDWLEAGENWRIAIDGVTESGEDKALAFLRISIRGKGSGVPVEQRIYSVMTVRGSRISKIDDYTDRARALETAGLDEQSTP